MTWPEADAVWLPRADNDRLGGTGQSSETRFVVPGSAVRGEFGLFEITTAPHQPGALPHFHRGFSESFYVLSGRLAVLSGHSWQVAGSGDFAYVPPHGVHGFRAVGDEPARFLVLFVPGAPREKFFRGLAEFASREVPPTRAELDAFALDCDQINLRDWTTDPLPS